MKILAIDLGKIKSVACRYATETGKAEFLTVLAEWQSLPMRSDRGAYVYDSNIDRKGYAAMFGEATYDDGGLPYFLSTNVMIADGGSTRTRIFAWSPTISAQSDKGSNRFSRMSH